jgi:predicted helicase
LKPGIYSPEKLRPSLYRPFSSQWVYFDKMFCHRTAQMPSIFPTASTRNRVIAVTGVGAQTSGFSCLIADCVPNLHFIHSGQCFPRWTFDEDGSNRQDNIPNEAVSRFRTHYADDTITGDDIFDYVYGILHAPDYRTKFANDLTKELPRIPLAPDFRAFATAGKQLADLHLNYETGDEYRLNMLVDGAIALGDLLLDEGDYHVKKMSWASKGDKTAIRYNNRITLSGFPEDALRYVVSGKSALDWVIDRYCFKTDKPSGITNDANDWIIEQIAKGEGPDALIRLIQRVTYLSVETMKIVDDLPPSLEATP